MNGDKVQTSLWLDRDVKRLIEDEHLNLSRWVNEQILISLSVEHVEDIIDKIKGHEMAITTLQARLTKLQERKKEGSTEDVAKKQALDELREYYSLSHRSGRSRSDNLIWMMVPKKIARCKLLGKTPDEMLDELGAWADGLQQSKEEVD